MHFLHCLLPITAFCIWKCTMGLQGPPHPKSYQVWRGCRMRKCTNSAHFTLSPRGLMLCGASSTKFFSSKSVRSVDFAQFCFLTAFQTAFCHGDSVTLTMPFGSLQNNIVWWGRRGETYHMEYLPGSTSLRWSAFAKSLEKNGFETMLLFIALECKHFSLPSINLVRRLITFFIFHLLWLMYPFDFPFLFYVFL